MVVVGSQQETLDPGFMILGTHQQGVLVILRELMLPGGFDLVSPSFTIRDCYTSIRLENKQILHFKKIKQFVNSLGIVYLNLLIDD
ncbi:unnamed protein product [Schistosoma margrebowiei]|uniref:Uncharacterized protein n=1 Tax=Schistosoma margrebowiei TaxID=48269 RepID=A0A183MGU6_9TREM|nr:unnamed protein product [Schistosoma margrebowiei]